MSGETEVYRLTDLTDVAWLSEVAEEHGVLQWGEGEPEDLSAEAAEREANRLLGILKTVRDHKAANARVRTDEVQRAEQWLARVNAPLSRREAFLETILRAVAEYVPTFDAKSRELPRGIVGWRKSPERIAIEDPAAVLAWAKAVGVPTKVEETVPHATVVAEWKASAQVSPDGKPIAPPGCVVVPAEEVFFAKTLDVG